MKEDFIENVKALIKEHQDCEGGLGSLDCLFVEELLELIDRDWK